MSHILLLGAGRSVSALVQYLKKNSLELNLTLKVGDLYMENAKKVADQFVNASYFQFDITSNRSLTQEIHEADLVISMLPSHFHGKVALTCLETSTHLITASYLDPQIKQLDKEVKKKGLIFITECGLDPGIDHMSAMKLIDNIHDSGGNITLFKSFTGGLLSEESDTNPWNYKFTWSPRNVVLAGQGVVKFRRNGLYKYIPYTSLFKRLENVKIDAVGQFEAYANRDSLKYLELYGIPNCPTVLRGTLRRPGFCAAWDFLLTLGLTNDAFAISNSKGMSYREFLDSFMPYQKEIRLEDKVAKRLDAKNRVEILEKIQWLGLFGDTRIEANHASPAQILQEILEKKWKLQPEDKDMVVMQNQLEYQLEDKNYRTTSSISIYGDNANNTAMAKTVGLPIGIATRMILEKRIVKTGVRIPNSKDLYEPILRELEQYGIRFVTKNTVLK